MSGRGYVPRPVDLAAFSLMELAGDATTNLGGILAAFADDGGGLSVTRSRAALRQPGRLKNQPVDPLSGVPGRRLSSQRARLRDAPLAVKPEVSVPPVLLTLDSRDGSRMLSSSSSDRVRQCAAGGVLLGDRAAGLGEREREGTELVF